MSKFGKRYVPTSKRPDRPTEDHEWCSEGHWEIKSEFARYKNSKNGLQHRCKFHHNAQQKAAYTPVTVKRDRAIEEGRSL